MHTNEPTATVDLSKMGEDHDWAGWVYCGEHKRQIIAESAQ
jgi:hypothetical protein